MSHERDRNDREQTEHERSLRAVDPRRGQARFRPRLSMMDDDRITPAERGTMQDRFIFPEERNHIRRRR
jgi:hypothetical protein